MTAFATASDREVLARQLHRLISSGAVPIALHGAGRVLRMLRHDAGAELARFDEHIVGVIDDDPDHAGQSVAGLDIVTPETALDRGVKAVIITAEGAMQDAMWSRRARFLDRSIRVLCCPERFAGQTWDEALIDHYEHHLSLGAGSPRPYMREYPSAHDPADPTIRAAIARHIRPVVRIAEIGSGAGKWTAEFIDAAAAYTCIDYSARLLHEVVEHRFAAHRAKLRLVHDEHAALPGVGDGSIDLLFSVDVFVHFKIDLVHQFLRSIKRVLAPAGVAVVHFAEWNEAGIDRWERHDTAHHRGGTSPIHHVHLDWLRASAGRLGLSVTRTASVGWGMVAEFRASEPPR